MDSAQLPDIDIRKILNQSINLDVLIELVKARPIIWDRTAEGYRNKDGCILAWEEIYRTIFNSYDALNAELKLMVGKLIKQKWFTAKDLWQRTHKKRKEAILKGENFGDVKDNVRYENLKFLAKVYDRVDLLKSGNEEKMMDQNLGNIEIPPSPPLVDEGGENLDNAALSRSLLNLIMNPKTSQKHSLNMSSQKRKPENSIERNDPVKNEQGPSSHKTVVVNFDDRFNAGSLINATKRRTSSVDNREACKTSNHIKSPKYEQSTSGPLREETPLNLNKNLVLNKPDQIQKQESRSPGQLVKEEELSNPSVSADNDPVSEDKNVNGLKRKMCETTDEQVSRKRTAHGEKSSNTQLEYFLQVLKPRIEDFNKSQMMDFFFEILKPLINSFDKRQLLDFQIEALQLVRRIEGDEAT